MDESIFIVEMPELSNESVFALCEFLHTLTASFESHYGRQLRECYRQREQEHYQRREQERFEPSKLFDDEIPF